MQEEHYNLPFLLANRTNKFSDERWVPIPGKKKRSSVGSQNQENSDLVKTILIFPLSSCVVQLLCHSCHSVQHSIKVCRFCHSLGLHSL